MGYDEVLPTEFSGYVEFEAYYHGPSPVFVNPNAVEYFFQNNPDRVRIKLPNWEIDVKGTAEEVRKKLDGL